MSYDDNLIGDLFISREEQDFKEAERAAAKAAAFAAARPTRKVAVPVTADTRLTGEPFNDLREALRTEGGRKVMAAIMYQLGEQKRQGWNQGSVRLALEVVRRTAPADAQTPDPAFRINNDLAPAVARLVLTRRPDWKGWLEVRVMQSESAEVASAYNTPGSEIEDRRLWWAGEAEDFAPLASRFDPTVFPAAR
jgi:hypothetical protein